MKCKACDTLLDDRALKRKDKHTGDYLDLCNTCNDASQRAIVTALMDAEATAEHTVAGLGQTWYYFSKVLDID